MQMSAWPHLSLSLIQLYILWRGEGQHALEFKFTFLFFKTYREIGDIWEQ